MLQPIDARVKHCVEACGVRHRRAAHGFGEHGTTERTGVSVRSAPSIGTGRSPGFWDDGRERIKNRKYWKRGLYAELRGIRSPEAGVLARIVIGSRQPARGCGVPMAIGFDLCGESTRVVRTRRDAIFLV